MLAFALKAARKAADVIDEDLDSLRAHGFADEDIGAIAAFVALSNRMAGLIATAQRRVPPARTPAHKP